MRPGLLLPGAEGPGIVHVDLEVKTVPIIVRDRIYPGAKVDALRSAGLEPVIYLTSHGWDHSLPTTWDTAPLRDWPQDGILVRFDQEPNGAWPAPWAGMRSLMYVWMFRLVRDALEGRARLSFAPIWTGRESFGKAFEDYYIYEDTRVGLDIYAKKDASGLARNLIRAVSIIRDYYSGPIDVWECGILRGLPGRAKGLRAFLQTAEDLNIKRVVYTDRIGLDEADWDTPAAASHDWRMGGGMRRVWNKYWCT